MVGSLKNKSNHINKNNIPCSIGIVTKANPIPETLNPCICIVGEDILRDIPNSGGGTPAAEFRDDISVSYSSDGEECFPPVIASKHEQQAPIAYLLLWMSSLVLSINSSLLKTTWRRYTTVNYSITSIT